MPVMPLTSALLFSLLMRCSMRFATSSCLSLLLSSCRVSLSLSLNSASFVSACSCLLRSTWCGVMPWSAAVC